MVYNYSKKQWFVTKKQWFLTKKQWFVTKKQWILLTGCSSIVHPVGRESAGNVLKSLLHIVQQFQSS